MPEIICNDCGKRLFHENEDTLKIEHNVHKKFCRKEEGNHHSYMHREAQDTTPFDTEREKDINGKEILER
ncbi:MAG: hypothetical protein R1F52_05585 [Candidatus Nitrosoabyssus spongiisocia]|nr:MAG: hypothetical protein R1F52_05585 [Nitrosopumilaceae archaeon AB1(1)]